MYISYKKPEGKGSFKKITERVNKKPFNEHGEGENEERHNLLYASRYYIVKVPKPLFHEGWYFFTVFNWGK